MVGVVHGAGDSFRWRVATGAMVSAVRCVCADGMSARRVQCHGDNIEQIFLFIKGVVQEARAYELSERQSLLLGGTYNLYHLRL